LYPIWLVLSILALLAAGCAGRALPDKAEAALRETVRQQAGAEVAFEIVSAQKAPGEADVTIPTGVNPDAAQVGACPPAGESETWCVVIAEGDALARFLVQSQGRYWDAQPLRDADRAVFELHGCDNWDAP
jgi:hypothetical protein